MCDADEKVNKKKFRNLGKMMLYHKRIEKMFLVKVLKANTITTCIVINTHLPIHTETRFYNSTETKKNNCNNKITAHIHAIVKEFQMLPEQISNYILIAFSKCVIANELFCRVIFIFWACFNSIYERKMRKNSLKNSFGLETKMCRVNANTACLILMGIIWLVL